MTMIDRGLQLMDAQDFASTSASAVVPSEDVIDLGSGLTDAWGNTIQPEAADLVLVAEVSTTLASAGSPVLTGEVLVDSGPDVTGGTVLHTIVFTKDAAGTRKEIPLGKIPAGNQYLGIDWTLTGAALSAGKIDCYLALSGEKHD